MTTRPTKAQHDVLDHSARPRAHDEDAIGEEQRLVDIVGDEDRGCRNLAPDVEQHLLHHAARLRIERAERLVHQEHPRLVDQGPRDLDPLLHASRQLRGVERLESRKTDKVQNGIGSAVALRPSEAAHLRAKSHIVPYPLPRKQRVLLKHHAAIRAWPPDRLSIHGQTAGCDWQMPSQGPEQRGLAAAGGAENADQLARRDGEIEITHRLEGIGVFAQRDRKSGDVDTTNYLLPDPQHRVSSPDISSRTPMRATRASEAVRPSSTASWSPCRAGR